MSAAKGNGKKIFLIILIVAVLIGACFTTVTIYAKKQLNKPKFTPPEDPPRQSVTQLPQNKAALYGYVYGLFSSACAADDVEGSWHTDVNLAGDIVSPLSENDKAVVSYIRDNAAGQIQAVYPNENAVLMSKADYTPKIGIRADEISGFTAEQGRRDDNGNVSDDDYYFVSFTLNPETINTDSIVKSKTYKEICSLLSDAVTVDKAEFILNEAKADYKIDRIRNHLISSVLNKKYTVKATVTLKDEYAKLYKEKTFDVELPYETNEIVNFNYYGAFFIQQSMTVKPDDMKSLPASITVNAEATKEDYKLTFTPSEEGLVSIDEDGVMTVDKSAAKKLAAPDEKLVINMKFEYDGHTYTDDLTVYITELEVATDNV
ncbi:MAG: hypothetical protein J5870_05310 [Clostridia bacterium]|nr:hypothetical protein [Clostridia bacterium]